MPSPYVERPRNIYASTLSYTFTYVAAQHDCHQNPVRPTADYTRRKPVLQPHSRHRLAPHTISMSAPWSPRRFHIRHHLRPPLSIPRHHHHTNNTESAFSDTDLTAPTLAYVPHWHSVQSIEKVAWNTSRKIGNGVGAGIVEECPVPMCSPSSPHSRPPHSSLAITMPHQRSFLRRRHHLCSHDYLIRV